MNTFEFGIRFIACVLIGAAAAMLATYLTVAALIVIEELRNRS
jgi:hypothetical protein